MKLSYIVFTDKDKDFEKWANEWLHNVGKVNRSWLWDKYKEGAKFNEFDTPTNKPDVDVEGLSNIKGMLLSQQKAMEEDNGLDYCKNCGLSGKEVWEMIKNLKPTSKRDLELAVMGFVEYVAERYYLDVDLELTVDGNIRDMAENYLNSDGGLKDE